MNTSNRTIFGASLWLLAVVILTQAQATSGLRGLVTDPTGAILPHVTVFVKHLETNAERRLTTNSEGIYQDTVITTDLRLTRRFRIRERVTLSVIGEGFNIFNIANLGGYTGNLQSTNFGQATNRTNNIFGSGGPRAFQLAARLSF
jgi:hypothetical protein